MIHVVLGAEIVDRSHLHGLHDIYMLEFGCGL
jgi:hypothetical protein